MKRAPKKCVGARVSHVEEINDRRVGEGGSCGAMIMLLNFILKVRSDLCLERESLSKYFKIWPILLLSREQLRGDKGILKR